MKLDPKALLPCPFCTTGDRHVCHPASGAPPYVLCECGAAGAQKPTEAEAIAAWNRRNLQPKEVRELVEELRRLSGLYAGDYGYNVATTFDRAADLLSRMDGEGCGEYVPQVVSFEDSGVSELLLTDEMHIYGEVAHVFVVRDVERRICGFQWFTADIPNAGLKRAGCPSPSIEDSTQGSPAGGMLP